MKKYRSLIWLYPFPVAGILAYVVDHYLASNNAGVVPAIITSVIVGVATLFATYFFVIPLTAGIGVAWWRRPKKPSNK